MPRRVVILGSTGSIGTQALDVIANHPELFEVVGLAAGGRNLDLLAQQATQFSASYVAIADEAKAQQFRDRLRGSASTADMQQCEVSAGLDAVAQLATVPCDVVVNGVDGAVGLQATLTTLGTKATLALANKESLILGSDVVVAAAGGQDNLLQRIVPVDSEHSALAQSLRSGHRGEVERLILTASGGPFRGKKRSELRDVTKEQAMAHPTWSMGTSVTINSATMVNKALEIIEAHLLFGVDYDRIEVTIHAQSVVHSMVEFIDGSTIAQASPPDMRIPIALGMTWPDRIGPVGKPVDFRAAHTWTFEPADEVTFPATRIAREVGKAGGTYTGVFNAANEVCLDAFWNGRLGFLDIVDTVERVVDRHASDETARTSSPSLSVEEVLAADAWARDAARGIISGRLRQP